MFKYLNLSILIAAAAGCTVDNTDYCDQTHPCSGARSCDVAKRVCVGDLADLAMDMSGDLANPAGCAASSECTDAVRPVCDDGTKACRACAGASDDIACKQHPTAFRCDPTSGKCVECATSADCPMAKPVCSIVKACTPCAKHTDCASLVCKPDGSCADPNGVIYVDNAGGMCDPKTALGTLAKPYCDIPRALMDVNNNRPTVRVIGSKTPYSPITLDTITVFLLGPGPTASPTASIVGGGNDGIFLQGNTTAVVEGFEINGSSNGIECKSPASVTARRNHIHDNSGRGVYLPNGGNLVLDSNNIVSNGGGVVLSSATYNIVNNFIVGNSSNAAPGVYFWSSSGTFQFNTVARNTQSGTQGGISCNQGFYSIESSIVWGNGLTAGTQIAGFCRLLDTVTGNDIYPGAIQKDPDFLSPDVPFDFHLSLKAANDACCADKITAALDGGASTLPDHDVDGNKRPQGAGWDIGAHEAK